MKGNKKIMHFTYRNEAKLKDEFKKEIENELKILVNKYQFLSNQDQVHIDIEISKELKCQLKLRLWISKLGRTIACSASQQNIHTTIHQIRDKINGQLSKIKEKI